MGVKLSSSVADLSAEQRRVLEAVIGQRLEDDQILHWLVTSPGRQPTTAEKSAARAGLERIFAKVDRHRDEKGIEQAEFDAAVDEAIEYHRSHPGE